MNKTLTCLLAASLAVAPTLIAGAAAAEGALLPTVASVAQWAGPGALDSVVSYPQAVQITAGQDDANAEIKLAIPTTLGQLSLGLKTPLKKDAKSYTLATLDGLAGATSVELQYSGGWITGVRNATAEDYTNVCQRILETTVSQAGQRAKDELLKSAGVSRTLVDPARLKSIQDGAEQAAREKWTSDKNHDSAPCVGGDLKGLTGPEGRQLSDDYYGVLYEKGGGAAILVGVNGETGAKSLSYFEGATLASHDVSETVWSAGAFISYTPGNQPLLFVASYKSQRTYDDADSAFLCGPPGGGGVVTCINGPIGPPKKTTKQLLSFEGRAKFDHIGFAVTTTYDLENEVWGVDAPIYLISDAAGGLTGGIRLGWRDDTNDVKASIFVSKPFTLFGN